MNEEQQQQLNDALARIESLEKVSNVDTNELVIETLIKRRTDVVDSDVLISTVIGVGGGTVNHLDFPDDFIEIKYKGKLYRIPAYNAQRFV